MQVCPDVLVREPGLLVRSDVLCAEAHKKHRRDAVASAGVLFSRFARSEATCFFFEPR